MIEPVSAGAIGAVTGLVKVARDGLRSLRQANLADQHKDAVRDVEDTVSDISDRLFTIQTSLIELSEENSKLKAQLAAVDDWRLRRAEYEDFHTPVGGFVLRSRSDPKKLACPACAESQKQLQPLQEQSEYTGTHACYLCKTDYKTFQPKALPVMSSRTEYDPFDTSR